jgi:hypothetical protein
MNICRGGSKSKEAVGFNVRVQFTFFGLLGRETEEHLDKAKHLTFEIHNALQPVKVVD